MTGKENEEIKIWIEKYCEFVFVRVVAEIF